MSLNPAVEHAELHESFGAVGVTKKIRCTHWVRLHFFVTSCIQSIRTLQTHSTAESRLMTACWIKLLCLLMVCVLALTTVPDSQAQTDSVNPVSSSSDSSGGSDGGIWFAVVVVGLLLILGAKSDYASYKRSRVQVSIDEYAQANVGPVGVDELNMLALREY